MKFPTYVDRIITIFAAIKMIMMKKTILFLSLLVFMALISCSKSDSGGENKGTEFKFVSLVSADSVMTVNGITTVTANATGTGLKYKWSADYGTFIGSGSSVQWTVCHADDFHIRCQVTDANGNTDQKEIKIHVR